MIGLEDISVGSPGEEQSTGEGGDEGKSGSFLMDGFKEGDFMLNKEEVEKDGSCCEVVRWRRKRAAKQWRWWWWRISCLTNRQGKAPF